MLQEVYMCRENNFNRSIVAPIFLSILKNTRDVNKKTDM